MSCAARDPQRLFSAAQKRRLYLAQQGLCAECGAELEDGWHAHHIEQWSRGGATETNNGTALCEPCHTRRHSGTMSKTTDYERAFRGVEKGLRAWQADALEAVRTAPLALVEACPGAGKTRFAAAWCLDRLREGGVDLLVAVVPQKSLKDGWRDSFALSGLQLTTRTQQVPTRPAKNFHGIVITYQQLPNVVETMRVWAANGHRLAVLFDEVHHAAENAWGDAANALGQAAERVLSLSGTPFRPDGRPIVFVDYGPDGVAAPTYRYSYRQSVADNVCRPVCFHIVDSEVDWSFVGQVGTTTAKASEHDDADRGRVAAALFNPRGTFLQSLIGDADAALRGIAAHDPRAAGLVVCQPASRSDEDRDASHARGVHDLVFRQFDSDPELVLHEEEGAHDKIKAFASDKSRKRWIVSVRMISEGVDIPRLRVLVMASAPQSELLFRQIIGRVVRSTSADERQEAHVFLADMPHLREMAQRIEEEAQAGLRDREARASDPIEREAAEDDRPGIVFGDSTYEPKGVVISSKVYPQDWVEDAKRVQQQHPSAPIEALLAMRSMIEGRQPGQASLFPDDHTATGPVSIEERGDTLRARMKRLISKLVRTHCPDKERWGEAFRRVNARVNSLLCGGREREDFFRDATPQQWEQVIVGLERWNRDGLPFDIWGRQ